MNQQRRSALGSKWREHPPYSLSLAIQARSASEWVCYEYVCYGEPTRWRVELVFWPPAIEVALLTIPCPFLLHNRASQQEHHNASLVFWNVPCPHKPDPLGGEWCASGKSSDKRRRVMGWAIVVCI